MESRAQLDNRSKALRRKVIQVFQTAGRGHIGAAFSLIEILRVLYDEFLQVNAREPEWRERDRFILSKGHGCLALYVFLAEKGFFAPEELDRFCKSDGLLGGHPEHLIPGVEASTGSLGHGLSIGVGFALAAKMDGRKNRTVVVLGDGESNEGSIWEAALSASKHRLDQLIVFTDYNKQQSYSTNEEVLGLEPLADKWKAFGFSVIEVDGHDVVQIRAALHAVPSSPGKPTAIIAHTVKGRGVSFVERNLNWHHKNNIKAEEIEAIMKELASS